MSEGTPPVMAVVQRILPGPPDAVYDEWLDADGMREWMCPRPARATKVELDPRVGGSLRIDVDDEGLVLTIYGRYLVLDRPHRIQFTWNCTMWAPDTPDSVVTVLLEPHGSDRTLMTIHHTQLPPDLVQQHEGGWAGVAEQLAEWSARR